MGEGNENGQIRTMRRKKHETQDGEEKKANEAD